MLQMLGEHRIVRRGIIYRTSAVPSCCVSDADLCELSNVARCLSISE